jgi:hypothetical protein
MEIIRRLKRNVPEEVFIADDRHMGETVRHLPGLARQATERPDEYWEKQQSAVWNSISAFQLHGSRIAPRIAWEGIAAVVALAMMLLFAGSASEPAKRVENQNGSDHELLLAVERAVQIDGPEALEPAALLAQEINGNSQTHSADKGKQNHED